VLDRFLSFLILHTVYRSPWTGDQPVARPLPTHRTAHTETPMPQVRFEPTTPVSNLALDCATSVVLKYRLLITGFVLYGQFIFSLKLSSIPCYMSAIAFYECVARGGRYEPSVYDLFHRISRTLFPFLNPQPIFLFPKYCYAC
jgi:hypothetical protein